MKPNPPPPPSPAKLFSVGVLGLAAGAFLYYGWMKEPLLASADVTQFSGTVVTANELSGKNGYLEMTITGQPRPFRCLSRVYPARFDQEVKKRFGIGAPVTLGVATREITSPRRNWLQGGQDFYSVVTMKIAGKDALLLSAINETIERDRKAAPWVGGGCGLAGIFLIGLGFWRRKVMAAESSGSSGQNVLPSREQEGQTRYDK